MRRAKDTGALLAPIAVAAFVVVCCAGLPVIAGAFAGLTLVAVLGLGGGLIALVTIVSGIVLFVRARRRRPCRGTSERPAR
jgi:hypothetical protein